jgi:hypothetical protein
MLCGFSPYKTKLPDPQRGNSATFTLEQRSLDMSMSNWTMLWKMATQNRRRQCSRHPGGYPAGCLLTTSIAGWGLGLS